MENDVYLKRHSLAHFLAAAVLEDNADVKIAIGPAIENGFYYDFDFSDGKGPDSKDLERYESKMNELIKKNINFIKKQISQEEAKNLFQTQPYKLELVDDLIQKNEELSVYQSGDFTDLCNGPHIINSREIDTESFKLTKIAGAYWRGDEKNKMLTRIYGVAFSNKKELEEFLKMQEEAAERDHRELGKKLDLFTFSDLVGAGLPLFTPKGTVIRTELQNALLKISKRYDMLPVTIPHLAKIDLYEKSGHARKFAGELFRVVSHYNQEFVLKPVNCPHHTQIYASKKRSYKDLPLRYMESTMQYRDEKPGEIGGLTRVRAITVDDGHIFCMIDQIKNEVQNICKIIEEFYAKLGMFGKHWVSLSVRDPKNSDAYIGELSDWEKAENMLKEISDELKLDATRIEGEAAIYGPKLDYMFKDSFGKERQLATVQIDFAMPKRFGLAYTDTDGKDKAPVMIHRAILGSYERFLAILIEHFAGAFPLWLSPVQVKILPISDKHIPYAKEVFDFFKNNDMRVELDEESESLGKKIRCGKMEKVPYLLIIGDKELESKTVTIESRDKGNLGQFTKSDFIFLMKDEIDN